jgi:DNA-binding transcriptional MerR regulator
VVKIGQFIHHKPVKIIPGLTEAAETDLTVAAVARRLGVAPSTLRTWDRRYGLGPSGHQAGAHRRYSASDLARLTMMRRLVINGVPPVEAARKVLLQQDGGLDESWDSGDSSGESLEKTLIQSSTESQVVEVLLRAAQAFDRGIIETMIRREVVAHGVINTWNCILVPLLIQVGDQWAATGSGIEIEHFLSEIVNRILGEQMALVKNPLNVRPVLLACVGEEAHSLAITALAAALAEKNIDAQFLGARTPKIALNEIVRRTAPPAIFLWAQLPQNADHSFIHELPSLRPAPRIIVGGPGWKGLACSSATQIYDLQEAVTEISRAVGV